MVTSGAVPFEQRENQAGWSECVTGALPEQEYLDLIAQAGFGSVTVRRSTVSGEIAGVQLYSAIVAAQKGAKPGTMRLLSTEGNAPSACGCGSSGCCS